MDTHKAKNILKIALLTLFVALSKGGSIKRDFFKTNRFNVTTFFTKCKLLIQIWVIFIAFQNMMLAEAVGTNETPNQIQIRHRPSGPMVTAGSTLEVPLIQEQTEGTGSNPEANVSAQAPQTPNPQPSDRPESDVLDIEAPIPSDWFVEVGYQLLLPSQSLEHLANEEINTNQLLRSFQHYLETFSNYNNDPRQARLDEEVRLRDLLNELRTLQTTASELQFTERALQATERSLQTTERALQTTLRSRSLQTIAEGHIQATAENASNRPPRFIIQRGPNIRDRITDLKARIATAQLNLNARHYVVPLVESPENNPSMRYLGRIPRGFFSTRSFKDTRYCCGYSAKVIFVQNCDGFTVNRNILPQARGQHHFTYGPLVYARTIETEVVPQELVPIGYLEKFPHLLSRDFIRVNGHAFLSHRRLVDVFRQAYRDCVGLNVEVINGPIESLQSTVVTNHPYTCVKVSQNSRAQENPEYLIVLSLGRRVDRMRSLYAHPRSISYKKLSDYVRVLAILPLPLKPYSLYRPNAAEGLNVLAQNFQKYFPIPGVGENFFIINRNLRGAFVTFQGPFDIFHSYERTRRTYKYVDLLAQIYLMFPRGTTFLIRALQALRSLDPAVVDQLMAQSSLTEEYFGLVNQNFVGNFQDQLDSQVQVHPAVQDAINIINDPANAQIASLSINPVTNGIIGLGDPILRLILSALGTANLGPTNTEIIRAQLDAINCIYNNAYHFLSIDNPDYYDVTGNWGIGHFAIPSGSNGNQLPSTFEELGALPAASSSGFNVNVLAEEAGYTQASFCQSGSSSSSSGYNNGTSCRSSETYERAKAAAKPKSRPSSSRD